VKIRLCCRLADIGTAKIVTRVLESERIENHDGVLMRINKGLSDLIFQFGKGIKNISFFNLRRRVCCRASQFVASVKIMLHPLFLQSIPMT
jgi:hypothetical protein